LPFRTRLLPVLFAALALACARESVSRPPAAQSAPGPAPQRASTPFDGERAFGHVKAQVAFGPRPAGSAALEKTREYLVRELEGYGLKAGLDEFMPATPRGKVRMKNIVAELPGATDRVVIIASHYDTKYFKEFAFLGANDGASSTGALLEIARVMAAAKEPRRLTYWFVFFDGEEAFCREWGECLKGKDNTYGSRHMVERLRRERRLERVGAMILLDMVGDRDLAVPRDETSSPWLVAALHGTAAELGYEEEFPGRTSSVGDDDHMPFLRAGVPAVDVIDFDYGDNNEYWHTAEDTLDKVSARSLKVVGDVVLLSLPKIEAQIR
jgi:glutaminyl-peptide cyclotransferase